MPRSTSKRKAAPRWRRRILLGLFALGAVGFTLAALRLDEWARRRAEVALGQALDGEVRLAAVDVQPLRLRAVVSGLEIKGQSQATRWRVSLERGTVSLSWGGLWGLRSGTYRLREVLLERPALILEEDGAEVAAQPRQEGGVAALDLRIDRLEVHGGRAVYAGRSSPIEIRARDLRLDADRSPDMRAMLGRLSLDVDLNAPESAASLPARIEGNVRLRGQRLDLLGFSARGEGLQAGWEAQIDWGDPAGISGKGDSRIDLARWAALIPASPDLAGTADLRFTFAKGNAPLELEADGELRSPRFGDWRADTLAGRASFAGGTLELTDLHAEIDGHALEGSATWTAADPASARAAVRAHGIPARALLDPLKLPLPFHAALDAEMEMRGDPRDPSSWSAAGRFDLTREKAAAPGRLAVSASGEAGLEAGRIWLHADRAEVAEGCFALSIETTLDPPRETVLVFEGESSDLDATRKGTLQVLRALGAEIPELLERRLSGEGEIGARLSIGAETVLDLRLGSGPGQWGELEYDALALDLGLDDEEIELRHVRLSRGDQKLDGSVRLARDDLELRSLAGTAADLEIAPLQTALGFDLGVDGLLNATMSLVSGPEGLNGEGAIELRRIRYLGESVDRVASPVRVGGGLADFTDLVARGPALDLSGRLRVDLGRRDGVLDIAAATLELAKISWVIEQEANLGGFLDLDGRIELSEGRLGGRVALSGRGIQVAGYPIGEASGHVDLEADRARITLSQAGETGLSLESVVGFEPELPLDGTLRFRELTADLIPDSEVPWIARVDGEVRAAGPLADPAGLRVEGTIGAGQIRMGLTELELAEPLEFWLRERRFETAPARLRGASGQAVVRWAQNLDDGEMDAALNGVLDLAFLSAVVPDLRASGETKLELIVRGTPDNPDLKGSVDVVGARLRLIGFPYTVDQLDLSLSFSGEEARATRLRGVFAGGEFQGEGTMRFDRDGLESYEWQLEAKAVRMNWPAGFKGVSDASLRLSGDTARGTLSGRVSLIQGRYTDEFAPAVWAAPAGREYSGESRLELAQRLFLDLDVVADDEVWVKNDTAKLESSFDLHLGGTLEQPEITGRFVLLEGGKIEFRNVDYTIVSGSLDFLDPGQLQPYMQILAQTTVANYDIRLQIEGTPDRFEYTLTSNPVLDQEAIIMLLATGRTPYDVSASGGQQRYTGDLAANYFAGALTAPFEKQLQKVLGLDRIQIDPFLVEGEADPTTRVTLRKEVSDDVAVIYSSDVGEEARQLYKVEWQPRRRFSLSATQDTIGGLGADLGWRKRYWWKRSNRDAAQADGNTGVGNGAEPVETVGEVRVEGVGAETAQKLSRQLELSAGQPYRRSKMVEGVESLRRALIREGRITPRVEARRVPVDPAIVDVVYTVEPGPAVEVAFEGLSGRKEERRLRRRLADLWTESFFNADIYEDSRELIRDYFLERGYYTADISYRIDDGSGGRSVLFVVDPGKQIRVNNVTILGASKIEESRIRRQMLTRPSSIFSRRLLVPSVLNEDRAAIRNLYLDHGMLDVQIAAPRIHLSAEDNTASVELGIVEGPTYSIGRMEFSGVLPFPERLLAEWSELGEGESFSRAKLLAAQGRLRAGFDRRGFPDARVGVEASVAGEQVHVAFDILAGGQKRIAEIVAVGNNTTPDRVIMREIDVKEGDWISRADLLRNQHALYKLGTFSSVRMTYVPLDPTSESTDHRLEIRVREAQPLGFRVKVGADSETGARINMGLTHDNIGGRGRALGLHGYLSERLRRVQVVGQEPRLFGQRYPTLASFSWEEEEEPGFVVRRRGVALRVSHEFTPRWSGYTRYNFQRVTVFDVADSAAVAEQKLENLRLGDIGAAMIYSTLDDPFRARSGDYLSVSANVFAEPLFSDAEFVKSVIKAAKFIPLPKNIGFGAAIRVGVALPFESGAPTPISERFFAGGSQTLRGFALDSVGPKEDGKALGGEAMLLFNEELQVPLWRSLNLVTFVDVGNVYRESADIDLGDLREVAGLGLRLETPIGPLRFEYGWKLDRRPGETGGEFFISIGPPF